MCVCVCVCWRQSSVCVYVCVCVLETELRVFACVCVWDRALCVCVCVLLLLLWWLCFWCWLHHATSFISTNEVRSSCNRDFNVCVVWVLVWRESERVCWRTLNIWWSSGIDNGDCVPRVDVQALYLCVRFHNSQYSLRQYSNCTRVCVLLTPAEPVRFYIGVKLEPNRFHCLASYSILYPGQNLG